MSLAIVYTRAKCGIDAPLVRVETHLSNGLPAFNIVGLPETAVKESKDRVRSAIINSHFEFPSRRITINLAPADLPKEGGRFDLAIALGILGASDQIPRDSFEHHEFIGELGLTGELRPVQGTLPVAIECAAKERALVVPTENRHEATLCEQATILSAENLLQLSAHLHGREKLHPCQQTNDWSAMQSDYPDLSDVKGQPQAKRALEICAAGNHNLLMSGPPGTGKTMLASRLPGLLPPLTQQEALEVAAIFSINSVQKKPVFQRPFRNPHHTASAAALVGGGSNPKPGEISLAHRGVLFLDELPEFQRQVLEMLREPMESGEIMISRAKQQILYPAKFQLIAAMNPCPCGFYGDQQRACRCTPNQLQRYRDKISGPLLDRIDIQLNVNRLPAGVLSQKNQYQENSNTVRQRVIKARVIQINRCDKTNAELEHKELERYCQLQKEDQALLDQAVTQLHLSPRAYHRILRVARTIADLEEKETIETHHLMEALGYRALDRQRL